MPITPTYPGVYIEELPSPVHAITGVATSIAAFIGFTARGIDQRAEQIFSFSDYERLFGGLESDSELGYAVQQFFSNGGSQAYVVRVPRPGGAYAQVSFANLTFTALSKGAWANGNLIIDVDYNNVNQNAAAGGDPLALNLTITNLDDGTIESFPSVSLNPASSKYVLGVVNDIDNGSQLVNVAQTGAALTALPAAPATLITGTLSAPINVGAVTVALAGTGVAVAGTVQLAQNSPVVTGTGTQFQTALQVGQWLVFAADASKTPYRIAAIASATSLTLATPFSGANVASTTATRFAAAAAQDFWINLSTSAPAPAPLPLGIKVFAAGSPIPQSVAGLASQLAQRINSALALSWPGAYVQCSVSTTGTPAASAIRVNAFLPTSSGTNINIDDVVTITAHPGTGIGDAAAALGFETGAPTPNVAHYALGTTHVRAQQTASTQGQDGQGLPGTGDLIGDPLAFTGLYALDKVDLFNLLSIPDATRAAAGNPNALDPAVDPNAVYSAAISYCKNRRAMLLVDPPPFVKDVPSAIDWKTSGLAVHDENGIAYFPRLRLADPLNNFQLRTFAPSGLVAGLFARIDSARGVWKAPAGTEATLTGVQSMVYKLTDAENGVLNPLGLNCFRMFPVYGPVAWGARTLVGADADASQWKYVPVRRLALYIEQSLYQGTQWAVFEPNDEPLWAQLRLNIGSFMNTLFRKGAFQGSTPAQAYLVKCDSETTTQADIDNGIVNVLVGFAPLLPAEFVVIQIQQLAGQVQT